MTGIPLNIKGKMGFWMCTALVVGNMIGSGVFLLPSSMAAYGGISIVGWLISAAGAILLAMVFARLSRMVPRTGGPYAYTRHGFGDFAGFIVAWGYWLSILSANAAIAVAFVSYLTIFWPVLAENNILAAIVAISAIWLLTGVNAIGARPSGYVQLITTVIKILPLVAVGVFGIFYFKMENFVPFNASGESSIGAINATVALTLWAFLGLESGTVPAGQVKDRTKTIPRATLFGTAVTAAIYILGTVAVMGIISPDRLAVSTAPFSDAATGIWGSWAGYAVAVGAVISCFGALNGWILLQGQIPFASARDGLFPAFLCRVSANRTPVNALVFSSVLVTILIFLNYTKTLVELFTFVILLATLCCLIPYVFSTMAELMILAKERRATGAKVPVGSVITAILAFVYSIWAIAGSGQETVYWGFLLLMMGIPIYVWMKWRGPVPDKKENPAG